MEQLLQQKSEAELHSIAKNYNVSCEGKSRDQIQFEIVHVKNQVKHLDYEFKTKETHLSLWKHRAQKYLNRKAITSLQDFCIPDSIDEVHQLLQQEIAYHSPEWSLLNEQLRLWNSWERDFVELINANKEPIDLKTWVVDIHDTIQKVIHNESNECFCSMIGLSDFEKTAVVECPKCNVSYHRICLKVTRSYDLLGCPCCLVIPGYNPFKKPQLEKVLEKVYDCPLLRTPEIVLLASSIQSLQEWADQVLGDIQNMDEAFLRNVLRKSYSLPFVIPLTDHLENLLKDSTPPVVSKKRKTEESEKVIKEEVQAHEEPQMPSFGDDGRYYFYGFPDYYPCHYPPAGYYPPPPPYGYPYYHNDYHHTQHHAPQ